MRGPSDKALREMPPLLRFNALEKVIFQYLDWLAQTAYHRSDNEEPVSEEYDDIADDLDMLIKNLRDYADAIEASLNKRRTRMAHEHTLKSLRAVTEERGYSSTEVANARAALARKTKEPS